MFHNTTFTNLYGMSIFIRQPRVSEICLEYNFVILIKNWLTHGQSNQESQRILLSSLIDLEIKKRVIASSII